MAQEGAYPVASPFAQHGIAIFAARHEKEGAIVLNCGEGKVGDRSSVPGSDERRGLGLVRHEEKVLREVLEVRRKYDDYLAEYWRRSR